MMKGAKAVFAGAALALTVSAVQAQPGYYGNYYGYQPRWQPAPQQQVSGPAEVLQEGVGKLVAFLKSGGSGNPAQMEAFINHEIAPYFDFAYMARWAAGPRYRMMSPEQHKQLEQALQNMFLSAMAQKLAGYQAGQVRYTPMRTKAGGEVDLGIQAYQPNGLVTQLDFRLYKSAEGWKVFDVQANGQSALVYYRQYFARNMGGMRGRPY